MKARTFLAVLFAFSSGVAAHAATVTIPAPAADTMISGDDALGSATLNFGGSYIGAGALGPNGGNAAIRSLIRFDLPVSIPADALITDVQMKVVVTRVGAGAGSTFRLRRLLKDWGEGNKSPLPAVGGAAATAGEATWLAPKHPSPAWGAAGASAAGDRASATSSSVFINGFATYTFPSTATLVQDVQGWLANPASNFGWLIQSDGEDVSQSARRFGSKEAAAPERPTLTITYTLPTPPDLEITELNLTATGMVLTWTGGLPGYQVERADNIAGPWAPVTPRTVELTATAPLGPTTSTAYFYRVASEVP